ncbi:MAG: hypothetical protein JSU66_16355 [Deltaproteobacteria bacterium]|nr:MAG: hypothetical protein JSU66_16355 [Deltaproteobacteria bacterium]
MNRTRAARLAAALLGALLLQSLAASGADACSCLPTDLVRSYNQSDAVLRVRVVRERVRDDRVVYLARVVTDYKGCLAPGRRLRLVTASDSARCGIRLEPGREYLVTADRLGRHPRILSIGRCGFNVPFEALTPEQQEFLDTRFVCCGDACRCVGSEPVLCFADPCAVASCADPSECISNYCGGCNAEFYDERGQAVCQPCENHDDCAFDQLCSPEGICRSVCLDSSECESSQYCSPGSRDNPFGRTDFGWLESPDVPSTEERRHPSNEAVGIYEPNPQLVEIAPSRIPSGPGICREDGECLTDRDCNDPDNQYIHPLCVGHGVCVDGACGWICGSGAPPVE